MRGPRQLKSTKIQASRGKGAAFALCLGLLWVAAPAAAQTWGRPAVDWQESAPTGSLTVSQVADWVVASRDNRGLPFAIVDKASAEVFVFGADGRLRGVAPALLGSARGDDSAPGVGDRELSDIAPEERTTPAGRFLAGYGPATGGKSVLWVDYATAISLHPIIDTNRKEQRPKRLKSPSPDDNRITYGCINVAADFYQDVVRPTFKGTDSVVYVLPEATPLEMVFPSLQAHLDRVASRSDRFRPGRAGRSRSAQ